MKRIIILTFPLLLTATVLSATADIYDEISVAIRAGSSQEVAKYINGNIDLTILTQENVYSKAQAELIIKDFFKKNTPKTFNIIHRGTSKDGAMYAIGNLTTTSGVVFRTYFFIKQSSGKYFIQELRFEKE